MADTVFNAAPTAAGWRAPVAVFVASATLSAFLLFGVQPMFAKMMLPSLGGAPAVWSVAMAVFQSLLLGGYTYAHLLTRSLSVRAAALVHVAVLLSAFAALPIAVAQGWGRPPESGEAFWLLGVFFASVGLPFFALSANGPLLQAWFAASGRKGAENPYFLYAASNLGSFGALIAYPLVIEPFVTLKQQSLLWTAGFAALVATMAAAGWIARGGVSPARTRDEARPSDRLAWVGLAFVPSGLLVAVTAHISTDVAAMPMLWIAPLALFLLTFVVAFRTRPLVAPQRLAQAQVWLTAVVLVGFVWSWPIWFTLPLHLGLFFVTAVSAHSALFRRRPEAGDLTRFYLYMSLGGVLGGSFCSLVAPFIFSSVLEYPILLVAALLCLAPTAPGIVGGVRPVVAGVFALATLGLGALGIRQFDAPAGMIVFVLTIVLSVLLALSWRRRGSALCFAAAAAVLAAGLIAPRGGTDSVRSFFGVHKLVVTDDGRFLTLRHGTTIHGATRILNDDGTPYAGPAQPTTYYTPEGALGQAVRSIRDARAGGLPDVAVIGLGTGSLACHAAPAERWRYFEIDAAVAKIASPGGRFPFLKECAPDAPVTLGDARLTLADQPGGLSLLVVDAFSSDAIPLHLLTREAIALYLSKLDPHGSALFHITNRHLDLAQILARVGAEFGLVAYVKRETLEEPVERRLRAPTIALVLTRDPADVGALATEGAWTRVTPDMARRPWSDDFSNVLEAIVDRLRL